MNNIILSLNKGFEFITPYMKKLYEFAAAITSAASDSVKKKNKKAKMHLRLIKIKNVLELISSIALLIATVIAIFGAVYEFIKKR